MTDPIMHLRTLIEKAPDADFLREFISFAAERLMEVEVGGFTGAGYGERYAERVAQRNDHRDRDWHTRVGTVERLCCKKLLGRICGPFRGLSCGKLIVFGYDLDRSGQGGGAQSKSSLYQTHLTPDAWLQTVRPRLPLVQSARHFETLDRGIGGLYGFEPAHGPDQLLELAMTSLNDIVEVLHLPVQRLHGQLSFVFQLRDCRAISRGFVGVDFQRFFPIFQAA